MKSDIYSYESQLKCGGLVYTLIDITSVDVFSNDQSKHLEMQSKIMSKSETKSKR